MKYVLIAFILNVLVSFTSNAQNWKWGKMSSSGESEGWLAATDKYGSVYSCGMIEAGSASFGSWYFSDSSNKHNTILAKYDTAGHILWAKQMKGNNSPMGIATDTFANIYVLGVFDTSIEIDSVVLIDSSIIPVVDKFFIAKYDKDGVLLWGKKGCASAYYSSPPSGAITSDDNGNIYISVPVPNSSVLGGDTILSQGSKDVLVAKYTSNGTLIWHRQFGGADWDQPTGITWNKRGHLFISGTTSATLLFDTSFIGGGNYDVFIAKMDTAGNYLWLKRGTTALPSSAGNVASDTGDNAFLVGAYTGTSMTFDTSIIHNANDGCIFLTKYNGAGAVVWVKNISYTGPSTLYGPTGYSVVTDPCGNIWICGTTGPGSSDTVHVDSISIIPPAGSSDPIFLAACREDGTFFQYTTLSSGGDDPSLNCIIACDKTGNIFVANDIWPGVAMVVGPDTLGSMSEVFYVAKYDPGIHCGEFSIGNVEEIKDFAYPTIFPNPAQSEFAIRIAGGTIKSAKLKLYDMEGRLLIEQSLSKQETTISTERLAAGVYYCVVAVDQSVQTSKLVIMR